MGDPMDETVRLLTDEECSRIVWASLSPNRVLNGPVPRDGQPADVLLVEVENILAEREANALRDAGIKIANMRTAKGRAVTNAAYLGEVVYSMGMDLDYQRERRTPPGSE